MGSKPKNKKNDKKPQPEEDPEVVTELMKEVFEIQLADIEKKINRINSREEELQVEIGRLEERIEEFEKENGQVISEHEQLLAALEEDKAQKREETRSLSEEIKIRIESHKRHVEVLEEYFNGAIEEFTKEAEEQEEQLRVLEDYKQNKDVYEEELVQMEKQLEEKEMQHQRNLFSIEKKWELAKTKVKKDLESRLLQLSLEFQQTTRKKIGDPCLRITQENKAIQNELRLMTEEIIEYEEKYRRSKYNITFYKAQENEKVLKKDKAIARTLVQKAIVKSLLKERIKLLEKLREYHPVEMENKYLFKKLRSLLAGIEIKTVQIEEANLNIEEEIKKREGMNEISIKLKTRSRRLQVLLRNALKIAEEAMSVHLIPMGEMEDEKFMNMQAKVCLFKKRRESAFQKKGKILQYLLDVLAKAQITEEDKRILRGSSGTVNIDLIDFGEVYGKFEPVTEKETEGKESSDLVVVEEEKSKITQASDVSLPRSISEVTLVKDSDSDQESLAREFEDAGEEEDEVKPEEEIVEDVEDEEEDQ